MPHALSFLHNYFNNEFLNKNYEKKVLKISSNKWQVSFYFNSINIILILKENPQKRTSLHFSVNDLKIIRKTKKINGVFTNFIQNQKNKRIEIIKNPMIEFYKNFFKNIEKKNFYAKNKNLTFAIMKKNYYFLNL